MKYNCFNCLLVSLAFSFCWRLMDITVIIFFQYNSKIIVTATVMSHNFVSSITVCSFASALLFFFIVFLKSVLNYCRAYCCMVEIVGCATTEFAGVCSPGSVQFTILLFIKFKDNSNYGVSTFTNYHTRMYVPFVLWIFYYIQTISSSITTINNNNVIICKRILFIPCNDIALLDGIS